MRLAFGTDPDGAPAAVVSLANRGALDVAVGAVGLVAADGRRLAIGRVRGTLELGGTLPAGQGTSFSIRATAVEQALTAAGYVGVVELQAFAMDRMGGDYRSAPVPFVVGRHVAEAPLGRRRRH